MSEPMSKAAKKNAKRRVKKKQEQGVSTSTKPGDVLYKDMLQMVKDQLVIAKEEKNHQKAGKLRDQIWVLTDLVQGIKTQIPQEELLKILDTIDVGIEKAEPTQPTTSASSSSLTPEEKKIRTLKKKLQQIEVLKERQSKGDKLEESQVEKIKSEEKIQEEIEELEDLLDEARSLR